MHLNYRLMIQDLPQVWSRFGADKGHDWEGCSTNLSTSSKCCTHLKHLEWIQSAMNKKQTISWHVNFGYNFIRGYWIWIINTKLFQTGYGVIK